MEIWRDVVGYEGLYKVSNKGNVKSLDRVVKRKTGDFVRKGKISKQSISKTGYHVVGLTDSKGKSKIFKVHRLVGFAFIPKIEGKDLINHKDGNPLNNKVENLEWCNQKENMMHAYENDLVKNNFHKNKDKILYEYKTLNSSINSLSLKYGCCRAVIRKYLKSENLYQKQK